MAFSFRAGTNWCHDFPKLARESGFHFNMHRRKVRVDWNRISSIDIDRVIGERDFSTIDDNVNNVVDYCLESEYDVKILDPNFVKLFRLAQLAVEYLLYCKQYLDHSVVILKDELRSKLEENLSLKNQIIENEKTIKELRDKLKERSKIIETKLSDSHGEIHKCPQCPKTFVSALFMSAHVNRRHKNLSRTSLSSPVHEQYRAETEKLHSEIKCLKERLNLTERVIRNESEKLLSTESLVSKDNGETRMENKNEARNRRDREDIIEEQHRRYHDEIIHLKATLSNEIRNLKYERGKPEFEDYSNNGMKELLRDQENEIKRLRQQLETNIKPETELADGKRESLEIIWQTKIENLESRYRSDIEKLYSQLRMNQESADRMRMDYTTRISDLERREASLESTFSQGRTTAAQERSKLQKTMEIQTEPEVASIPIETSRNHYPIEEQNVRPKRTNYTEDKDENESGDYHTDRSDRNSDMKKTLNSHEIQFEIMKKPSSTPRSMKNYSQSRKQEVETNMVKRSDEKIKRENKSKVQPANFRTNLQNGRSKTRVFLNSEISRVEKCDLETRERLIKRMPAKPKEFEARRTRDEVPKKEVSKDRLESSIREVEMKNSTPKKETGTERSPRIFAKNDESETISDEEGSGSWLETESDEDSSETDDEEDEEKSPEIQPPVRTKNRYIHEESWNLAKGTSENSLEIFHQRLRELGIDPEWRGLPAATFAQVMEIIRHHRNINSKKYRKFEEIRARLIQQLTRRLLSRDKSVKPDDFADETQLGRLMTNVKTRVSKALNILDANDGSRNIRKSSGRNKLGGREEKELRKLPADRSSPGKSAIASENDFETFTPVRESLNFVNSRDNRSQRYGKNPRREIPVETPNDHKLLSHSYESIKDFINDTKPRQVKSVFDTSGGTIASAREKNDDTSMADSSKMEKQNFDVSTIRTIKQHRDSFNFSVDSPRNNGKSVLKSTSGTSVGNSTKKKVLFDLETDDKQEIKSMYPSHEEECSKKTDNDTSESDFEISSIRDEKEEIDERKSDSPQSGKVVLLRTSQSEKIAQISQQIEQQLSIARRKPVGAVEAMFLEKLALGKDERESGINVYPDFTSPSRSKLETFVDMKIRKTGWENHDSGSSKNRKWNDEPKDENLEMEIEELLQME